MQVGGLTFGPASLVDLLQLHLGWYAWTMQGGPKPEFLKKNVAYYVMQADKWRYADTLEQVTAESRPYNLSSIANAADVLTSGSLGAEPSSGAPDQYIYDPHDRGVAAIEDEIDPASLTDQSLVYARPGKLLVYHSAPFDKDTEVSGFFKLSAWIAIDQPDTDFAVSVYEIRKDGSSILLTKDLQRARYREGPREAQTITTRKPLLYVFKGFTFTSRRIESGSRLRLVIAPVNSIYSQKNYNSGKDVSAESMKDAQVVVVTLYHDRTHPSTLFVPIGRPE
jgi:putative CocE/NonD family hydrolase